MYCAPIILLINSVSLKAIYPRPSRYVKIVTWPCPDFSHVLYFTQISDVDRLWSFRKWPGPGKSMNAGVDNKASGAQQVVWIVAEPVNVDTMSHE